MATLQQQIAEKFLAKLPELDRNPVRPLQAVREVLDRVDSTPAVG
jgi:hypothetical protein